MCIARDYRCYRYYSTARDVHAGGAPSSSLVFPSSVLEQRTDGAMKNEGDFVGLRSRGTTLSCEGIDYDQIIILCPWPSLLEVQCAGFRPEREDC